MGLVCLTATEVGYSVQTSMTYARIKLHENPTSSSEVVPVMQTDRLKYVRKIMMKLVTSGKCAKELRTCPIRHVR